MCTSATLLNSNKAEAASAALKLLVNGGPRAQKMVGIWLFGCSAWVFSLVVLGGVTRLTRSGLSMTDWKFTGSLPPLLEDQWLCEFEKYQQSPEYKRLVEISYKPFSTFNWLKHKRRPHLAVDFRRKPSSVSCQSPYFLTLIQTYMGFIISGWARDLSDLFDRFIPIFNLHYGNFVLAC